MAEGVRGADVAHVERLARTLFEEQERLLPESEAWNGLSESDKSFWRSSVKAVLREVLRMIGEERHGVRS